MLRGRTNYLASNAGQQPQRGLTHSCLELSTSESQSCPAGSTRHCAVAWVPEDRLFGSHTRQWPGFLHAPEVIAGGGRQNQRCRKEVNCRARSASPWAITCSWEGVRSNTSSYNPLGYSLRQLPSSRCLSLCVRIIVLNMMQGHSIPGIHHPSHSTRWIPTPVNSR